MECISGQEASDGDIFSCVLTRVLRSATSCLYGVCLAGCLH